MNVKSFFALIFIGFQNRLHILNQTFRYLISRGYGHPQDKDSGGSDDDMSDEGPDDMLPSTSRDRLDASGNTSFESPKSWFQNLQDISQT